MSTEDLTMSDILIACSSIRHAIKTGHYPEDHLGDMRDAYERFRAAARAVRWPHLADHPDEFVLEELTAKRASAVKHLVRDLDGDRPPMTDFLIEDIRALTDEAKRRGLIDE